MSKVINQDSQETFFISTVTMSFNPMEDRVVMDSSDKNEKVERLWLSRRLLDRLIPSLTDQLEIKSSNEIPTELEQTIVTLLIGINGEVDIQLNLAGGIHLMELIKLPIQQEIK